MAWSKTLAMPMPTCFTEGCTNMADPRWFVHDAKGSHPACDGCGCAKPYLCPYCKVAESNVRLSDSNIARLLFP